MSETIYLANVTVRVVKGKKQNDITYNNRSFVDGTTHIKGNLIVKVEKIGLLGIKQN